MTRLFGNAAGAALGITLLALGGQALAQGQAITPGGSNLFFTSSNDSGSTVPGSSATNVLVAERTGTFNGTGFSGGFATAVGGTYISDVFENTTYGTYSFYYQFTNNASGSSIITDFGVNGFSSSSSVVGFTTSSVNNYTVGTNANNAPATTASTTTPQSYSTGGLTQAYETSAGNIDFNFSGLTGGGIAPGATSTVVYVQTNATSYSITNGTFTGAAAANSSFGVYDPGTTNLTPEPGSLALFVPGVLGVVGMLRRRKRA